MGNAEFKSLSHVTPINTAEVLSICRNAMSSDDLLRGSEQEMAEDDPWMPLDRTAFSLLFESNMLPFQFSDQIFDAYVATMHELGGEKGLRRPSAFSGPLSSASKKPTESNHAESATEAKPTASKQDLNEIDLKALELSQPTARVDFTWLLMHLFAVMPHSAPMALVGDVDKGLNSIQQVNRKGATATWLEGQPATGTFSSTNNQSALIPVDERLSILYDVFLRRAQRLARIKNTKNAAASSPTNDKRAGGRANTPTKVALIKEGRKVAPGVATELSIADIKDSLFATSKLAVCRYRGVSTTSSKTQYPDRRCAGCQTIPTNLTFDCSDCLEASMARYYAQCAEALRAAAVPVTARTDNSRSHGTTNGQFSATMNTTMGGTSLPSNAVVSAASMTAPVHALGIPITTLLCNRCVGQYEGYGSGLHQHKHLKTHSARKSNWAPNPLRVTHIGTECSACGMTPITGTRHRCLDCLDRIDLCEACHRDAEEPLCHSVRHRIWKITVPLTVDEEVNSFVEEIIAPLYNYVGVPRPLHAVTRRINPNHTDTDYSENHNQDYSVTHFTDALLTVDQRREIERERTGVLQIETLKAAALRIAHDWPAHVSELLNQERQLEFLEAQERAPRADPVTKKAIVYPTNTNSPQMDATSEENNDATSPSPVPEDVAAARLKQYYLEKNSDEATFVNKATFIRWGNQSEVIAALFRGFEVRYAKTCTDMEGVDYTEFSSMMAAAARGTT